MDEAIKLDGGSTEERIEEAKRFFGLNSNQSFQDLNVDVDEDQE